METFNQILLEAIKLALAGIAGGLIGARANDRLARRRERETAIREDKLKFIPFLNQIIKDARQHDSPYYVLIHYRADIEKAVWRFRLLLSGNRQRVFDEAWKKLEQTTEAELTGKTRAGMHGENQWMYEPDELRGIQKILISRLQALLDCVENA
jgi:hypothetical protein